MTYSTRLHIEIAILAFSAVGAATYLQKAWTLEPCTMCILQRYAFIFIGLLALLHGVVATNYKKALSVGISLAAGVGILAGARIQWVMSVPSPGCGRDAVARFLNELPWAQWAPSVFEATGVCGDKVPPVMGLPFHAWGMILLLLVLTSSSAWKADDS